MSDAQSFEEEQLHPAVLRARELRTRGGLPPSLTAPHLLARVVAIFRRVNHHGEHRDSAA